MLEVRQKWVRVILWVRPHPFRPVLSDLHLQDEWESQLTWQAWVSQHETFLSFQVSYLFYRSVVLGEPCFSLCAGSAHTSRWWRVHIWESRRPPVINCFYMDIYQKHVP